MNLTGMTISTKAKAHRERTGHADLDVDIDKPPSIEREIDATITVNE